MAGSVCNAGGLVEIEIFCHEQDVSSFLEKLKAEAPPLSVIDKIEVQKRALDIVERMPTEFSIRASSTGVPSLIEVPPDAATCEDCVQELFESADRRFQYPFINCTNCGPRFTIIGSLPYDRGATTMGCFPMCQACKTEFEDPLNRRFHAQPNACWECGPQLSFVRLKELEPPASSGESDTSIGDNPFTRESERSQRKQSTVEAIELTLRSLEGGNIVAIKGLGGYHLCCDATCQKAVEKLRERKHREAKSLAVMFPDLDSLQQHCHLDDEEARLLASAQRPIVLLKRIATSSLPGSLSPDNELIGAMLPYTPLHHIITKRFGKPLVMTSGNYSEEPIAIGNREAINRLGEIADTALLNNRDIATRYDDSLVRVVNKKVVHLRRARGYAPAPIVLPFRTKKTILAVGGHLKNTFCLLSGNRAYLSQHIGDMERIETIEHYMRTLETFCRLFELAPAIIVRDLHPGYITTSLVEKWLSMKQPAPFDVNNVEKVVDIQHHFAHAISCMVSNNFQTTALSVTFDGSGYGSDGTLWGGEVLLCSYEGFKRAAHINYVGMPGGELAVREPWRMALSWMESAGIDSKVADGKLREAFVGDKQIKFARQQLARKLNCPMTSSGGRLFDAVATILGISTRSSYEGQAAIKLETAAWTARRNGEEVEPYPFEIITDECPAIINFSKTIAEIYDESIRQQSVPIIALRFHRTIAQAVSQVCSSLRKQTNVDTVCLTGGVFQNALLTEMLHPLLEQSGFRVLTHGVIPPNDGGISLGQAVAAAAQLKLIE